MESSWITPSHSLQLVGLPWIKRMASPLPWWVQCKAFAIGALLAHSLRTRFAPHEIGSAPFVLFLGIAMSITAFPVLARILEERGIQSTEWERLQSCTPR